MKRRLAQWLVLSWLVLTGWLLAGCQAPDPENAAARPWNSPTGWEHGLPTGLNEGR